MPDHNKKNEFIKRLKEIFEHDLGFKVIESNQNINLKISNVVNHELKIQIGRYKIPILFEVKEQISHMSQIKKIIDEANKFNGIIMVCAYVIEKKIKNRLKGMMIGYYELNQEIYIPLNILTNRQVNKGKSIPVRAKGLRAASNMKLLLYFICKPESLSYSQRELAEKLGFSLGAINHAIKNLETIRLIILQGKKRFLGRFEDLVDRWRFYFLDTESKNNILGTFSPLHDDYFKDWKKNLIPINAYWGGEPAASIRTQYLSPENFSIYTYNLQVIELLRGLRLKKDVNGRIKILRCFWPEDLNNEDGTVPDFVTYCELLNTNISRNIETAKMLEHKIKMKLKKYEY